MNSLVRLAKPASLVGRRLLRTTPNLASSTKTAQKFDPNNYHIERLPTMDDLMEPYGSWKQAYEAERKLGNWHLLRGILAMGATITLYITSGVLEGLYMPNLDNIMEETEPFNFDTEGRISV